MWKKAFPSISMSGTAKLDYRDKVPIKALAQRDGKLHPLLLFDILNRVSGKEPKAASRSVSAMHALI